MSALPAITEERPALRVLTPAGPPPITIEDGLAVVRFNRFDVDAYIVRFMVDNQRPPTLRDIQEDMEISRTSVVAYVLRDLELAGKIEHDQQKAGGIRLARPPRCACCGGIDYAALLATLEPQQREAA